MRSDNMPHIIPISDLQNNFDDISRIVHETAEPIFLTKNGDRDIVVMSMEAYERHQFKVEVYFKLREAELEAKSTEKHFSYEEVFSDIRARLVDQVNMDEI